MPDLLANLLHCSEQAVSIALKLYAIGDLKQYKSLRHHERGVLCFCSTTYSISANIHLLSQN